MIVGFEYKLINQHCDSDNRVQYVTWQIIANCNEKTSNSEFTHTGPGNVLGELDDEQMLNWLINQIHPSDLAAMRAGLAANVQNME
jgi:hypothetical protein